MVDTTASAAISRRIVHLIDSGGFFGAEQVVATLAEEQRLRGNLVCVATIIAPQDDGNPLGDVAKARGIEVAEIELPDGFRRSDLPKLRECLGQLQPDVVHCHGYKAIILAGFSVRRDEGWHLVATLHGWTAIKRFSKMRLYQFVERLALRRFDAVCPVSDQMRAKVARLGDRVLVQTVANGIQLSAQQAPLPEDLRARVGGRPIVLAVGRLSAEKDLLTLIECMARLRARDVSCCLVIVGEGPERPALEQRAMAHGLTATVCFAGYRTDVRQWMGSCDVFTLSSLTEGLPMVVLEALAAGLPVVSTRVGGIPDAVAGSDVRLVSPRDVDGMSAAIEMALSTDSNDSVRSARKAHVSARFGSAAMATAYDGIYAGIGATAQCAH